MASAQVVETSVTNNSPSQDSNHPDYLFQSRHINIPDGSDSAVVESVSTSEKRSLVFWDLPVHTKFIIYLHDMKVKEDFKHAAEGTVVAPQNPIKENTNFQNSYLAHELRVCMHKNNIIN